MFSAKNTPYLKIADAARITTSIPGFFTPIYVELDDEGQIIFDTDSNGQKHLRCSDIPARNNPRQLCLVEGGLIDNIGNDLKNVMGIQNSLVAVFYLLKMQELHPCEQIRLDHELSERCRDFLEKNQQHDIGKRDRIKNKAKSGLTKIKIIFDNDEKNKQDHNAARDAVKETARTAREADRAIKQQQSLVKQRSMLSDVKKVYYSIH